jgi:hypothetical protein
MIYVFDVPIWVMNVSAHLRKNKDCIQSLRGWHQVVIDINIENCKFKMPLKGIIRIKP